MSNFDEATQAKETTCTSAATDKSANGERFGSIFFHVERVLPSPNCRPVAAKQEPVSKLTPLAIREAIQRFSTMRWSAGLLLAILAQAKATAVSVPNGSEVERFARKQPLQFRGGSVEASPKVFRRLGDDTRMPSLFLPSESLYDRYAACLAATEGLRRIRDRDLSDEMRENGYIRRGLTGEESEQERKIKAQYIQNSSKVLRALGMSVGQFNELGKQISQNEGLKEKVRVERWTFCEGAI